MILDEEMRKVKDDYYILGKEYSIKDKSCKIYVGRYIGKTANGINKFYVKEENRIIDVEPERDGCIFILNKNSSLKKYRENNFRILSDLEE